MGSETERRKTKRYQLACRAYTVNNAKAGLIVDISEFGMAIRYIDRKRWPAKANSQELDITVDEHDFVLRNIPYSVVFEQREAGSGGDTLVVKRQGLRFGELNMQQSQQLAFLIQHFTAACAAGR